jgi:two-component system chemotaxis sensor kinase CheA
MMRQGSGVGFMEEPVASLAIVEPILDRLANGVIAGPDDLMGMGECMNLIEDLEGCAAQFPGSWATNLKTLKHTLSQIILENSADLERDWLMVGRLVEQLREGGDTDETLSSRSFVEPLEDVGYAPTDTSIEDDSASGSVEVQDPELLKDFIEEAKEHLSNIELNMLALETNPEDRDAINEVFRPFHSIKGVAGFLNLTVIHHLSHEVENLLDEARSGKLRITDSVIDIVLNAVDILKSLMLDLQESGDSARTVSSEAVEAFLGRVRNFQQGGEESAPEARVKKVGEILVDRGAVKPEAVEDALEKSKSTGKKIGEALISEGLAEPREVYKALREQRQIKENAAFVRIDTQKLDNLVDMVGELVIAQSMVLHNPEVQGIKSQTLQKDSVQLRRITTELQRISMSMRMVPIKSTFQKLIRLVRDLSKKSGKDVALEMKGEETEIDRNMVEEIYEPLVHMIRNSVDHGIETPEERDRSGKNPQGVVRLSAEQKGGNIVIEISDDGRGLDADKIRAKAIERGLISSSDVLEEDGLFELIFHPGFSTKDQVTEVSGRGVGMDVVKRCIEQLRGKMEIKSVLGKGASFVFKLPLTMAIIDGMVVRVGSERYIVPTVAMNESLRPAKDAYLTVQGRGELIKVRNQLMPLIRLHQLFDLKPEHHDPWEALVLVVGENGNSYCLLADEIIGRQEVVIKSLGASMRHLLGISGGAILGDGKVALIVDVKGVIDLHGGSKK